MTNKNGKRGSGFAHVHMVNRLMWSQFYPHESWIFNGNTDASWQVHILYIRPHTIKIYDYINMANTIVYPANAVINWLLKSVNRSHESNCHIGDMSVETWKSVLRQNLLIPFSKNLMAYFLYSLADIYKWCVHILQVVVTSIHCVQYGEEMIIVIQTLVICLGFVRKLVSYANNKISDFKSDLRWG